MADTTEQILQKLQRDINCLSDGNKMTRKRAIEKIKRETIDSTPHLPMAVIHELFDQQLLKCMLKLFSDPAEKCRELAISAISDFIELINDHASFLPYIMPVIVARLGCQEIIEHSEEIRLSLVRLLVRIVDTSGIDVSPYLHDMVTILQRTIIDPYPEVKKESCTCTVKLAQSISHVFHQEGEQLVKPLLQSLSHQHSKVRISSIKGLGAVIRYGSATPINDSLPSLAQRVCDPIPSVRLCTVNTIGEWLLDLPDRYSYHHKLIPLLCTALTDEVDDVKLTAHTLWLKIGTKYEEENEDDLKDKMDFAAQREPHPHLEFPRPPLGCRVLVYRSFSKILPAILRDITDWTATSRIKSSQLLYTLLYHLEGNITHHIQPVLAGLYKSCLDDEPTVVEWTMKSADVIGFYVSAETWCHLILPAVRISGGCSHVKGEESSVPVGPRQCTGCLMILSCLISGCPNHSLEPYLMVITECVAEPELGGYYPLLIQLNSCVFHLIQSSSSLSLSPLSFHLFTILLRGLSDQQVDQSLTSTINGTLLLLADGLGLNDVRELYQIHAKEILKLVKVNYKDWTVHSSNCSLFASLLSSKDIGLMVGGSVDDIVPLIAHCTHHDQDPEMRLRFITLLIQCILNTTTTKPSDDNNFTCIITDVVIPCCVWRSGRTAAGIRTAAMTAAQALLKSHLISSQQVCEILPQFLPQVISCLDDDNTSTRVTSCKVLTLLFQIAPAYFTIDQLHQLFSDLLKRLDDSSNETRLQMSKTLIDYFSLFPQDYDSHLYKAHVEVMYSGLLVHLDDTSYDIQVAILSVLQSASVLSPSLLKQMAESAKDKHRTDKFCIKLLEHIANQCNHP